MPFDPNAEILPQELFNLIIEFTQDDRRSLCDLCLVSKAFLTDSQRCLYKRVGLGGVRVTRGKSDGWRISNANNDTIFFRTLACIPRLAHYVQGFSFRPDTRYRGNQFWSLFHQALHQMVNLRSFQLTLMSTDPNLFRILEELSDNPFQLETFRWRDYRWAMTANESMALLSFLASQPSLRVLDVVSSSSLALPQIYCPNLSTFIGDFEMALSVLPERAITNFVWIGGEHEPTSHLSTYWQAELSRLRVLIFHDYFPVTVNLEDLVSCLQSLEALQISYEHDSPNESTLKEVTELLRHLPALKNLRMLVCTGFMPLGPQEASSQTSSNFEGATSDLFDSSPSLRCIYYNEKNSSGSQGRYLRWARGTAQPVEVGADVLADSYRSLGFDSSLLDSGL
ncbi:hypothetical protein P691DRAFT_760758 [Macrolepiota fuliginosa MF-IS2]|uniref:F-box domain-containing protein n=1 Tax=Macrolepiota fuliginosa MF-IS2 TaxID=1400762 RepID=A0A9P6C387_9AGAR|nr:hypothetical protein P691DRAFT_760758 [Macrolepiota fuliginosa MF-IS2]